MFPNTVCMALLPLVATKGTGANGRSNVNGLYRKGKVLDILYRPGSLPYSPILYLHDLAVKYYHLRNIINLVK